MKNINIAIKTIAEIISKIKDSKMLGQVLNDILTPQEILEIAERIQILSSLKKGMTQRVIAKKLGVSITTVNRGSRILKYGTGVTKNFI